MSFLIKYVKVMSTAITTSHSLRDTKFLSQPFFSYYIIIRNSLIDNFFPPELSFVHGNILLPKSAASIDLKDSCLSVRIQEERLCEGEGCQPNIVESFVQKNVKMSKPGIIKYSMPFDGKPQLPYVILATLNVGWCKQGNSWIRPGDYHSVTSSRFDGMEEGGVENIDVSLEGYKTGGKKEGMSF